MSVRLRSITPNKRTCGGRIHSGRDTAIRSTPYVVPSRHSDEPIHLRNGSSPGGEAARAMRENHRVFPHKTWRVGRVRLMAAVPKTARALTSPPGFESQTLLHAARSR